MRCVSLSFLSLPFARLELKWYATEHTYIKDRAKSDWRSAIGGCVAHLTKHTLTVLTKSIDTRLCLHSCRCAPDPRPLARSIRPIRPIRSICCRAYAVCCTKFNSATAIAIGLYLWGALACVCLIRDRVWTITTTRPRSLHTNTNTSTDPCFSAFIVSILFFSTLRRDFMHSTLCGLSGLWCCVFRILSVRVSRFQLCARVLLCAQSFRHCVG